MSIKTAAERLREKYPSNTDHDDLLIDYVEFIEFQRAETAELRADYEALSGKYHELKARSEIDSRTVEAQAKRIEELEKCIEILQRPLDDQIISRIVCLVKNIPDEELASNVFESVRNMTNWNKSTPAEFLVLFDKTAASKNGE